MVGFLKSVAGAQNSLANVGKGGGGGSVGIAEFTGEGTPTGGQRTFSFEVPAGVAEIFVVCIGGGGRTTLSAAASSVDRGGTILCSANGGGDNTQESRADGGVKDGGGAGGYSVGNINYGGGAGGYSGDGGNGESAPDTGSGGGHGAVGFREFSGGTGLRGLGVDGTSSALSGSVQKTNRYQSYGASDYGGGGGELSWKNNVTVTPGETLTVKCAGGITNFDPDGGQSFGAVGIYWGACGTFPELEGVAKL